MSQHPILNLHSEVESAIVNTLIKMKAAANVKEATVLIEAGFQYVTTIEGTQLFKKRK